MTSKLRMLQDDQLFHPEQSSTGSNCIAGAKLSMEVASLAFSPTITTAEGEGKLALKPSNSFIRCLRPITIRPLVNPSEVPTANTSNAQRNDISKLLVKRHFT